MIKLNINPFFDESMNCLENIAAAVALWWERNYKLAFSGSWSFNFKSTSEETSMSLADRIYIGKFNFLKSLEYNHGIKMTYHKSKSDLEILEIIRIELNNGRPVAIYINCYWCPWHELYKKSESGHYCLVVGYDESDNSLHCIDAMPQKIDARLGFEDFSQGYGPCITFSIVGTEHENIDYRNIITNASKHMLGLDDEINPINSMRSFADEIEHLNIANELQKDPQMLKLSSILNSIARDRLKFKILLEYIRQQYGIHSFSPFEERFGNASILWNTIRGTIMKACYMPDNDSFLQRISKRILEASIEEENIAYELLKVSSCNNDNTCCIVPFESSKQDSFLDSSCINNMFFVDLSSYFNNQGFGSLLCDNCSANLNGINRFLLTQGLPEDNVWVMKDMSFSFPNTDSNKNDNVICMEQEIPISTDYYSCIMMLGCSDFGDFSEHIVVTYDDGAKENVPLQMSNVLFLKPNSTFGEFIAWEGNYGESCNGKVEKLKHKTRLYATKYNIDYKRKVVCIKLPYCPNIHLFSITLYKYY